MIIVGYYDCRWLFLYLNMFVLMKDKCYKKQSYYDEIFYEQMVY